MPLPLHAQLSAVPESIPSKSGRVSLACRVMASVALAITAARNIDSIRVLEARLAAALGGSISPHILRNVDSRVAFLYRGNPALADVTRSCSSVGLVVAVTIVGLLIVRVSAPRRAVAVVVGAVSALIVNTFRLVALLVMGTSGGLSTLSTAHDLGGAPITVLGAVLAISAMLFVARRKGDLQPLVDGSVTPSAPGVSGGGESTNGASASTDGRSTGTYDSLEL
jgi:exosortase/archaeosortase family protein